VAMGAGASLQAARVTPARMAAALRKVVGNTQVAAQGARLAARFAGQGGVDGLCARLETLA